LRFSSSQNAPALGTDEAQPVERGRSQTMIGAPMGFLDREKPPESAPKLEDAQRASFIDILRDSRLWRNLDGRESQSVLFVVRTVGRYVARRIRVADRLRGDLAAVVRDLERIIFKAAIHGDWRAADCILNRIDQEWNIARRSKHGETIDRSIETNPNRNESESSRRQNGGVRTGRFPDYLRECTVRPDD
jgi:hypothetical protein